MAIFLKKLKELAGTSGKIESDRGDLKKYRAVHYLVMQCLFALENSGFMDYARKYDTIDADLAAQKLGLYKQILISAIQYISLYTDIFETTDNLDIFKKGRGFVSHNIHFFAAYKPLFDAMDKLMRKELVYGKDIIRDGSHLQRSGTYVWKLAPYIESEFKKFGVKRVVDLGCGSGQLLLHFISRGAIASGVGIDIDPIAMEAAKKNAGRAGLENKFSVLLANVAELDKYLGLSASCDGLLAINMMHEFFRDGEDFVISLFQKFKKGHPGKYFFLIEFEYIPWEKMREYPDDIRRLASLHALIHPLSFQGNMQPRSVWLAIFKKAGISCKKLQMLENNMLLYTLRF